LDGKKTKRKNNECQYWLEEGLAKDKDKPSGI